MTRASMRSTSRPAGDHRVAHHLPVELAELRTLLAQLTDAPPPGVLAPERKFFQGGWAGRGGLTSTVAVQV
jgi:hypothetical protein